MYIVYKNEWEQNMNQNRKCKKSIYFSTGGHTKIGSLLAKWNDKNDERERWEKERDNGELTRQRVGKRVREKKRVRERMRERKIDQEKERKS